MGPSDKFLGLRGSAEGLLKLGLMTSPVGVAVSGGGGAVTVTALTPSSVFQNDPTYGIAKARDGDNATSFNNGTSDIPFLLTIQLSSPAKLRFVSQILRPVVPEAGMGQFTLEHSDNGTSWTAGSDGTKTFTGYAAGTYAEGQICSASFSDDGAHLYWRLNVTQTIGTAAMPALVGFSEVAFATDTAGTQLLVGP